MVSLKEEIFNKKLLTLFLSFTFLIATMLALVPIATVKAAGPFPDTPVAGYPIANDTIYTILTAPDGSQYVGGRFTEIGGVPRNYLAHILSDGTVDPDFDPNISGGGFTTVSTLALDSATNTLYVGGGFTTVNGGTTRNNLAAFNTTTGTATSFNPNMDSSVSEIVFETASNTLYVGGGFTTVNGGTTRNYLAAFNTTTGTANSFNPNMGGAEIETLALDTATNTLYVGGNFNTVNGGTTRNYLAALNTTTGTATSFNPDPDGTVYTFALDTTTNTLYVGGGFTTVNGATTRNRLAALNTTTGTANSFNPSFDPGGGEVVAIALDASYNFLYAGGDFTMIDDDDPAGVVAFQGPPPEPDNVTTPTDNGGASASSDAGTLADTGQDNVHATSLALLLMVTGLVLLSRYVRNIDSGSRKN